MTTKKKTARETLLIRYNKDIGCSSAHRHKMQTENVV